MNSPKVIKPDEPLLLSRISEGDEPAFAIIYNRYRKKIYSFALKMLKSEESAEDIVHEVFLKIWQHPNPDKIENLENYLYIIGRNGVLKQLKRQQLEITANRKFAENHPEICEDTEQMLLWKDAQKLLHEAVEHLPPQQRMVFRLCREEGMKYDEVAERMAISRLTVKTHMQHALRFLRTYVTRNSDVVMALSLIFFSTQK